MEGAERTNGSFIMTSWSRMSLTICCSFWISKESDVSFGEGNLFEVILWFQLVRLKLLCFDLVFGPLVVK
jgi:hypothetical protein